MYQVVGVGGTDRQLLASFPSKAEAKEYALEMNTVNTEVVNEKTGLLVGSVGDDGNWREQTRPVARPVAVA